MKAAQAFAGRTLRNLPQGEAVQQILAAALAAVEPGAAVRGSLRWAEGALWVGQRPYASRDFDRIWLVSVGKAALAMAGAAAEVVGECLHGGLIITKHAQVSQLAGLPVLCGGHPLPNAHSLEAGQRVAALLAPLGARDLVLCCISGGGSALMTLPQADIALEDVQALTANLLACGANIAEMNLLRRRLDGLKAGGLARWAAPATVVGLILSDVVGDALHAIASGPTAPDPTTVEQVRDVLTRYGLEEQLAPAMRRALLEGAETPKPGDMLFDRVQNVVVGSNLLAAQATLRQAAELGFQPYLLRVDVQGEARQAGVELAQVLRWAALRGDPIGRPACLVAGGETTVTLRGSGRGGRNQELALAAVAELAGLPDVLLVTLATDGEDGPTDAAGAVVSGQTWAQALQTGLYPPDFLTRNDSYSFFAALDDLLRPGPSGTNVNDLTLLFAW